MGTEMDITLPSSLGLVRGKHNGRIDLLELCSGENPLLVLSKYVYMSNNPDPILELRDNLVLPRCAVLITVVYYFLELEACVIHCLFFQIRVHVKQSRPNPRITGQPCPPKVCGADHCGLLFFRFRSLCNPLLVLSNTCTCQTIQTQSSNYGTTLSSQGVRC